MKVYEMEMEFECTVGLNDINNFMGGFGFNEKFGVNGPILTLKQTLPFIPNDEYIQKVENILREHYRTEKIEILSCKFKGYKKFLEREIPEEN